MRTSLNLMLTDEAQLLENHDYIALRMNGFSQNLVWREKVAEWCYKVTDHLGEDRSVVYSAISILDRFCANPKNQMTEPDYQVASMTALFLSVRISGSGGLTVQDLASMSRGDISERDIVSVGTKMIKSLSWDQRLLTPFDFLRVFLLSLPKSAIESDKLSLRDTAYYLIEISVYDAVLSKRPASEVAAAAFLNSIQVHQRHDLVTFASDLCEPIGSDEPAFRSVCDRVHSMYEKSSGYKCTPNLVSDCEDEATVNTPDFSSTIYVTSSNHSVVIVETDDHLPKTRKAPEDAFTGTVPRSKRVRVDLTSLADD